MVPPHWTGFTGDTAGPEVEGASIHSGSPEDLQAEAAGGRRGSRAPGGGGACVGRAGDGGGGTVPEKAAGVAPAGQAGLCQGPAVVNERNFHAQDT